MALSTTLRVLVLGLTVTMAAGAVDSARVERERTKEFVWTPGSSASSLIIAHALAASKGLKVVVDDAIVNQPWKNATCTLRSMRPGLGEEPVTDTQNRLGCEVSTETGASGWITLMLNDEPMARWGNQFHPMGVSLQAGAAQALFLALANVRGEMSDKTLLTYHDMGLASPSGQVDSEELAVRLPSQGAMPIKMMCLKEYIYPLGAARPEIPTRQRCDFISFEG